MGETYSRYHCKWRFEGEIGRVGNDNIVARLGREQNIETEKDCVLNCVKEKLKIRD